MYSKLVSWEVYNFMAISHGKCEFDDSNIIVLKGYNDSGKSAMLRALDVLFYNRYHQSQVSFIKDNCSYFRIVANFDDGVMLLRDKYINGQSLYEMYKGNELVFSTKVGDVLTRVTEVPEPIQTYLGVVQDLCSRNCYEKQFLVQTSGSENDKVLNVVLKTKEIGVATTLLNNDKNALGSEISALDVELHTYKGLAQEGSGLTEELVSALESLDKNIDTLEKRLEGIKEVEKAKCNLDLVNSNTYPELSLLDLQRYTGIYGIYSLIHQLSEISISPEVGYVDTEKLSMLSQLNSLVSSAKDIKVAPKLDILDTDKLSKLIDIYGLMESLGKMGVAPLVKTLDSERLDKLAHLSSLLDSLPDVTDIDNQIDEVHNEMHELAKTLGDKAIICPDCGHVIGGSV